MAIRLSQGGSHVRQLVKFGKDRCRCSSTKLGGDLHEPYWYLLTKSNGRTKSKFIGKDKPAGA